MIDTSFEGVGQINAAIPAWEDYLAATGRNAALVRIPHKANASDNCIILIPGGQAP